MNKKINKGIVCAGNIILDEILAGNLEQKTSSSGSCQFGHQK